MPTDLLDPVSAVVLSAKTYPDFKQKLATSNCPKCPALCTERHNIVVDRGNPTVKVMAIGEAPGEKEDLQGKAFVGRSGQLLDRVLLSIGIDTNRDLLIANVVKCRPPKNRPPTPLEAQNCFPYLEWQLNHVRPKVVLLLGATAAKHVLPASKESMKDRVGKFFDHPQYPFAKFMLLYHPAFILRDPRKMVEMVAHVNTLKKFLGEEGV